MLASRHITVAAPLAITYAAATVPWSPKMPNSDLWTMTSSPDLDSETGHRRVLAHRPRPPVDQRRTQRPRVQPQPRIHSSTIRPRTTRFLGRVLYPIHEEPERRQSQFQSRKRSYAMAALNGLSPAHPARPAPAARYTTAGAPLATPTQVQSPRVLFPVTLAGSPCYQSLDTAAQTITASLEERGDSRGRGAEGVAKRERIEEREDAEQRMVREVLHLQEAVGGAENVQQMEVDAEVAARRKAQTSKWLKTLF
ncbi:hypothetical protein B0H10DRAFT_2225727 [Mycena sp. CBHHK59/15]|nr:hypothetical protein B0H10DRAFT_2225727 [Mycena sp. CBHHK59/15]